MASMLPLCSSSSYDPQKKEKLVNGGEQPYNDGLIVDLKRIHLLAIASANKPQ